jgi:catechol 2,3-dioxygenase-like lactoylglutathione lyase family enzyme
LFKRVSIVGLEALVYGVEDLARAAAFYDDWGLERTHEGAGAVDFSLADGTQIRLRNAGDPTLPDAVVGGSTVREIVWGVASDGELRDLGAALGTRARITPDGTVRATDPLGYALAFVPTTARALTPSPAAVNVVGSIGRRDSRAEAAEPYRVRQQRMIHAVLWVPRKREEMRAFYCDVLGFHVTESVTGVGWFLRAPLGHDHHNLFLQTRGNNAGFQHVAFEVRNIDEVMLCGRHMEAKGWRSHVGPGRHVAGSNVYWYFDNPGGGLAEVGCDIDYITDHWTPREHESIPHGGSSWFIRNEDAGRRPGWGDHWPQHVDRD